MSAHPQHSFHERAGKAVARRRQLSKGAIASVNHDGLIIARPRRQGFSFPSRGVFLILLACMLGKAALFVSMGEQNYAARVEVLAGGSKLQQVGAWAMTPDWATREVSRVLRPWLH